MPNDLPQLVWKSPNDLKNHPRNIAIFGDSVPSEEMVESVKRLGILQPLEITPDDTIVQGHLRKNAARIAGCKAVPCIVLDTRDPLEIRERLCVSNRDRRKDDPASYAKMIAELVEIETERAKQRKGGRPKDGDGKPRANAPEVSGTATEIVARKEHLSKHTVERLAEAGRALVKAQEKGDSQKADAIKSGLAKSARAGANAATSKPPKNGQPTRATFNEKSIDEPYGKLLRAVDARVKVFPTDGRYKQVRALLGQVWKAILEWRR